MPRQRWRDDMLHEMRGMRIEMAGMRVEMGRMREEMAGMREEMHAMAVEIHAMRTDMALEFQRNRDVTRDFKAAIDRNTEVTERCSEILSGLTAQAQASERKTDDMIGEIKAQTAALLTLIDEIRGQNGSRPTG